MSENDDLSPNVAGNAHAGAEELPYAEGSVWSVQFARIKPGMTKDYLKNMRAEWKGLMDEAQRQNLILSYRILLTPLASPEDWDLMLMIEVRNMAALDGYSEKMEALATKLLGTDAKGRQGRWCAGLLGTDANGEQERRGAGFVDTLGWKLLREVTLK